MSLTIRPRLESDILILTHVLSSTYESDGYPVEGPLSPSSAVQFLCPVNALAAWTVLLDSPVASEDPQIVGQAVITPGTGHAAIVAYLEQNVGVGKDKLAFLGRLFVGPEARGKGAGKALVLEAMRWAEGEGTRLLLDVMIKDEAAIRLYEKLGWRKIAEGMHADGKGGLWNRWSFLGPEVSIKKDEAPAEVAELIAPKG